VAENKDMDIESSGVLDNNSQKTLKSLNQERAIMNKKCILCEDPAQLAIKATNDYYCKECAEDQFNDISCLVSLEENFAPVEDAVDQFEEVKDIVEAQREEEQSVDENEIEELLQSD
jgi:hypothetical protein